MAGKEVISVDLGEVKLLVQEGKEIVFKAQAEEALLKLLELQEAIDRAIDTAKLLIEEAALAYNPNFTSVQGDRIKAGFQFFGAKYAIDQSHFEQLPARYYKTKVTHSPDSKAIDDHIKEHGSLPLGIAQKPRSKKVTFRLKENFVDEATPNE